MIPLPRAKTRVLAVPRSTARSLEKREKIDFQPKKASSEREPVDGTRYTEVRRSGAFV
jgi:hypothetical protein